MELRPYVESIRRDLTAAAEVAGEDARAAAERMTTALDAACRLALLDALSEAADEVTRELAPGSVELRLRAREPEFVVTPPPEQEQEEPAPAWSPPGVPGPPTPPGAPGPPGPPGSPPPAPPGEEQGTSRITLRMPESLKARVEEAAAGEGISVNAWLVRAVSAALVDQAYESMYDQPRSGRKRGRRGSGHSYTGWAR